MATTTLTQTSQKITVPANTDEHDIDFSDVLKDTEGIAVLQRESGTSVQFSANGTAIGSGSAALTANITTLILDIKYNVRLRYKGGAGSEVFNITITTR